MPETTATQSPAPEGVETNSVAKMVDNVVVTITRDYPDTIPEFREVLRERLQKLEEVSA